MTLYWKDKGVRRGWVTQLSILRSHLPLTNCDVNTRSRAKELSSAISRNDASHQDHPHPSSPSILAGWVFWNPSRVATPPSSRYPPVILGNGTFIQHQKILFPPFSPQECLKLGAFFMTLSKIQRTLVLYHNLLPLPAFKLKLFSQVCNSILKKFLNTLSFIRISFLKQSFFYVNVVGSGPFLKNQNK